MVIQLHGSISGDQHNELGNNFPNGEFMSKNEKNGKKNLFFLRYWNAVFGHAGFGASALLILSSVRMDNVNVIRAIRTLSGFGHYL